MVITLAMTDALGQADDRQRRHHRRGVIEAQLSTELANYLAVMKQMN
jgi:hypothetical protein